MKYTCCICPLKRLSTTSKNLIACPYDSNCSSMYSCGAYLADVKIKNHILKCQKCNICKNDKIKVNSSSSSYNDYIKFWLKWIYNKKLFY